MMARDQVLSFRATDETAKVFRTLPESEGAVADVEEAVAKAIILTVKSRRLEGATFSEWLLGYAEYEHEHPEPEPKAPEPDRQAEIERARAEGREEGYRRGEAAARRHLDAEWDRLRQERDKAKAEAREIMREAQEAVASANEQIESFNADAQRYVAQWRAAGFDAALAELLRQRGLDGPKFAQAVERRAEALLASWVEGRAMAPASAVLENAASLLDTAARLTKDALIRFALPSAKGPGTFEDRPSSLANLARAMAGAVRQTERPPALESLPRPALPAVRQFAPMGRRRV